MTRGARRAVLAACAAGCLAASGAAAGAQAAGGPDLARYRWRNRVLVLFAPAPDDTAYRREAAALARRAEDLRDRDVLAASVFERGGGTLGGRALSAADAAALRRRFRAPAGRLTAVLLGRDGRTTVRLAPPVVEGRLLPSVDGMPMGRAEAARRRGRAP